MDKTVTIQLTEEESTLFVEFQRRRKFMQLLQREGVFELKSGQVVINFDIQGIVGSVEIKRHITLL